MLHYSFHWWSSKLWNLQIDPSNRYIRKSSNKFLAFQGRFPNRFNRGPWRPTHVIPSLSAIRLIWKYQQAKDNNAAIIAKKRRVNQTFDSNKKKKRRQGRTLLNKLFLLQSAVIPKNKSDCYFLPWESSFKCFFFVNSFLWDTTYFGPRLQKHCFLMGKDTVQTKQCLDKCYSDSAPSETTVKRLYADFKRSRTDKCCWTLRLLKFGSCPEKHQKIPPTHFGQS